MKKFFWILFIASVLFPVFLWYLFGIGLSCADPEFAKTLLCRIDVPLFFALPVIYLAIVLTGIILLVLKRFTRKKDKYWYITLVTYFVIALPIIALGIFAWVSML